MPRIHTFLPSLLNFLIIDNLTTIYSFGTRPGGFMNVLVIESDQQRWDALGVNSAGYVKTPNLDALAARGDEQYDALKPIYGI